jgi:hypothetical protein
MELKFARLAGAALFISSLAVCMSAAEVHATSVTIQSTDSPWNYGGTSVGGLDSTTPVETPITPGAGQVLTFSSVTGTISLTPGFPAGPDGRISSPPGAFPMNVSAAAGLSGIISNNSAFLAGVFLNGQESASGHVTPATLSFGTTNSFTSLSPLDDQVFFIGDGLTGTGSGTTQTFVVPADATELVLAIPDANGYSGPPGAYFDNSGSFVAVFSISETATTPLPATLPLFAGGLGFVGYLTRRKRNMKSAHAI